MNRELLDVWGVVGRCIVLVKMPRFVLLHLLSLLKHRTKQTARETFADLLIDRLAPWQELNANDASCIEEETQSCYFSDKNRILVHLHVF